MTRFLDGPAAGRVLMLRRSPLYLRAVRGPDGKWDALDQLGDVPGPGEAVVAYRRVGEAGALHIDSTECVKVGNKTKRRRVGRWYGVAEYRVVDQQPADDVLRDTEAWRAWCRERQAAGKEARP